MVDSQKKERLRMFFLDGLLKPDVLSASKIVDGGNCLHDKLILSLTVIIFY